MNDHIDVTGAGAVLLGPDVACDGFHFKSAIRVQTHVHEDHLWGFDTSKGEQAIVMSPATRALLICERNADLKIRENLIALEYGREYHVYDSTVTLEHSGHMLGSCQVAVELSSGERVGYSGDFSWPLERVVQVDALVVDSTCGSPRIVRQYTQHEIEAMLLEIISERLRHGPVYIRAYKGTLHRALQVLSARVSCPFVGTSRLVREVAVYQALGYASDPVFALEDPDIGAVLQDGSYIRLIGTGDPVPVDYGTATVVELSAYFTGGKPVVSFSDRSYRVALSNHADFPGTLEYIAESGAEYVLTDNTRGNHAVELALAVTAELGIPARASANEPNLEWGA